MSDISDVRIYPHTLTTFRHYPRKFFLDRVLNIKAQDQFNSSLMIGTLVHKILESFYDEINEDLAKEDSLSHFLEVLDYLKKELWNYKIPQNKIPEVDVLLKNFALYAAKNFRESPTTFYPLGREITIKKDDPKIGARIDRISPSLIGSDYKTDRNFPHFVMDLECNLSPKMHLRKKLFIEKLTIQGILGAILIKHQYGKLPKKFSFIYLNELNSDGTRGILNLIVTREKINNVLEWIEDMRNDIKNDNFPHCTVINKNACFDYGVVCPYKLHCDTSNMCFMEI